MTLAVGVVFWTVGRSPTGLAEAAVLLPALVMGLGQCRSFSTSWGAMTECLGYLRAVELTDEAVRPGDSVCLSAYPMAELSINAEGGFVANVRRYWQPTFVIDATQAVVDGRVYDGYIVGHPCFSGMSGGAVFDVEGKVRGMAVATLTRTEPELKGDPTVVRNGIVLDVEHIRAFVEERQPDSTTVGRQRGP